MGKFCVLSAYDAEELERHGVRPDCHAHNHCNRARAEELVASRRARHIDPIKSYRVALMPEEKPGVSSSAGFTATQWLPGAIKLGRSALRSKYRRA